MRRQKRSFILDEAEISGSDAEHEDDHDSNEEENSADRDFIDDQNIHYIPTAPPPLFIEHIVGPSALTIEELPDAPPPLSPPPPVKQKPHTKTKITSHFKPTAQTPPTRPLPNVEATQGGGTPTPPQPPEDSREKIRAPKAKAPKRLCSLIQAHLVPAAHVGTLTFNLVTVIPDIERSREDSWKNIEKDYALVVEQIALLPAVFGAFICIETHGDTHSRGKEEQKRQENKKKKSTADKGIELPFFETNEGENEGGEPIRYMTATSRSKLVGKAHMHVLLWYVDHTYPRLDLSVFKRRLLDILGPNSDVQDKVLPENVRNRTPHYVRTTAYIFKGVGCPATADNWKRYVDKEKEPPLPEFREGSHFLLDDSGRPRNECVERWLAFLPKISQWCRYTVATVHGSAPAVFRQETRYTREQKDMREFAAMLSSLGIVVAPGANGSPDHFYRLIKRTDYEVLRTYADPFGINELIQQLNEVPTAIEYLLQYKERLSYWFKFSSVFDTMPTPNYDWVELKDGFYNIRANRYHSKDDEVTLDRVCFRAYPYTMQYLRTTDPVEWLALVDTMCAPNVVATLPDTKNKDAPPREIRHEVHKPSLLRHLALTLRKRYPKQPVPFLYGVSNCGKTTLSSYIPELYPIEAMGFLNSSTASLSGIHKDIVVLYCDEFKTDLISREDLLVLLDGAQPLTVRRLHHDAVLIKNPLMPILLSANFKPSYYNDDTAALDNRLVYFYFTKTLVPDRKKGETIREEHLFTVRYLNDWLDKDTANKKE